MAKPCRSELTSTDLKRELSYDPETGLFTRNSTRGPAIKGDIAGYRMTNGYVVISLHSQRFLAHRLAWLFMHGAWPKDQLDHINRIRHDNRIANLREATCTENSRNTKTPRHNTSGARGVWWRSNRKRWVAEIRVAGRGIYIGSFKDFEAAKAAYSAMAANIFGEFAPLEFQEVQS